MVKLQNAKDKKILKSNQRNDTLPIKEETTIWLTVDFSSENKQVFSKYWKKHLPARILPPVKVPQYTRTGAANGARGQSISYRRRSSGWQTHSPPSVNKGKKTDRHCQVDKSSHSQILTEQNIARLEIKRKRKPPIAILTVTKTPSYRDCLGHNLWRVATVPKVIAWYYFRFYFMFAKSITWDG